MTEAEYQILEDLYMTKWPSEKKRTNASMKKCEALYSLAKRAKGGCIVELGTYHGCGAISLALGARAGDGLSVYTVDDYSGRKGWAGEPYYPQDRARFLDCLSVAGVEVTLVQKDVVEACRAWDRPIALLFWDLGVKDKLLSDFQMWGRHMIRGGVFAVKEAGGGRGRHGPHPPYGVMGVKKVMEAAIASGEWMAGLQFPDGHVYTLEKK